MITEVRRLVKRLLSAVKEASRPTALREYQQDQRNAGQPNVEPLVFRLADVVSRTWYLGFTSFGGPPVHFQILHREFVVGNRKYAPWIDEQTYDDVFALCQALPGPASTKMLFVLILMHAGIICASVGFLLWSLPGAIVMFLLSVGVSSVQDRLPLPVYGLLSGLNAASVGIITLAAVELSTKASKDNLTRILVIAGGCAGLCYASLWYFPVLVAIGGLTALIWDLVLSRTIGKLRARLRQRQGHVEGGEPTASAPIELVTLSSEPESVHRRVQPSVDQKALERPASIRSTTSPAPLVAEQQTSIALHTISLRAGIVLVVLFFAGFIAIITTRSLVSEKSLAYSLFSNMILAGTIIFGGGPVVIPLLREYVVEPGWVSARDFLIGLAVIQALPGPNFNFAVYLGALALKGSSGAGILGAFLALIGIFGPGLIMATGVQSVWNILRTKPWVTSTLRGINSIAVGFVFTAVYRLWEIGYLTPDNAQGTSLANEPWWVVVAVLAFSASRWFHVPAAISILGGAVLGLCWYAVTQVR